MALVPAAAVLLAASCAPDPSDGPLQLPAETSTVCTAVPQYRHAALGVNLPDDLPPGLTIEAVEPVAPDGLSVAGLYLMPVSPTLRLMLDAFPPTEQFPDAWPDAVDAVGTVVPVGTTVDLVVEVSASGSEGALDGLLIRYSVDGVRYTAQSHLGLRVGSAPTSCGDDPEG